MSLHEFLGHLGLPATFPEFFPAQLEQYRRSLSEATDTPDEYAIAYMLAGGGTAAGADVSAYVQNGWRIRANLFMAIVGYKGNGKSSLAERVLAPLVRHEEALCEQSAIEDGEEDYDEEEENEGDGGVRRRVAERPAPCVIVNDFTGAGVLVLLERNRRQLLANPDEISTLFIRNTGGTDRQMWCELYDGRRRRQQRASASGLSTTLAAPYVCILGGIQPDVMKCMYGSRGDDGCLDRVLLVGEQHVRQAEWPRDVDDPALNAAWATAINRMLHIEELASDTMGGQVEARFTSAAVDVCRQLMRRLNELVALLGVPEPQRGIVKKLVQHAVKLALLHRCFRWAAGEFGEQGPFGDIDADDAQAAAAATLFFFGRWLIWRPELRGGHAVPEGAPVGLVSDAGDDPALQALVAMANGAQRGIRLIERLVRYVRYGGTAAIKIDALAAREPFADHGREDLREACRWLVQQEQGEWLDEQAGAFRLFEIPKPRRRGRREGKATPAVST